MPRSKAAKSTASISKSAHQAKQPTDHRTTTPGRPRGRPTKAPRQNPTSTKTEYSVSPAQRRILTVHDVTQTRRDSTPDRVYGEEIFVPKRNMSVEYGHGRTLESEEPEYMMPHASEGKRKRSTGGSVSPSKRVRFDSNPDETRVIQDGKVRSRPVSPAVLSGPWTKSHNVPEVELTDVQDLPADPAQHLLKSLVGCPEPLGLQSVAGLFGALQSECHTFSKNFFGFTKQDVKNLGGEHSRKNFPLHELEHTYPALFMTTKYLLDVPVDNAKQKWLNYFTMPAQRQALVYGIIGEWISRRVFNDSSFGLSENVKNAMKEEVDIPYIHYDSFVRAKKRAELIEVAFRTSEEDFTKQAIMKASSELTDELLTVLAPLMPTWRADDPFLAHSSSIAALHKADMSARLTNIVMKAAGLNLSLIRSGENNMVFRIAAKLERGREFNALAPMDCINLAEKMRVADKNPDILKEKKLMVRMTCWARIEAFVGRGLNREEMEIAQQELMAKQVEDVILDARRMSDSTAMKEIEKSYNKFCWDCAASEMLPELPKDLWKQQAKNVDKIEADSRSAKLQRQLDRQLRQEADDDDYSDDSDAGSDDSRSDDNDSYSSSGSDVLDSIENKADGVPRGAYITVFDRLVNHQVYCEWVTPVSDEQSPYVPDDIDSKGGNLSELNSLQSIVRAARNSSKSPLVKLADLRVGAWNLYASKNLWVEWASFLALIIYLSKGRSLGNMTVLTAKINDFIAARGDDFHKVLRYIFPNLTKLTEDFAIRIIESTSKSDGLLETLVEKLKEVIPMPYTMNFEDGALRCGHGTVGFGSAAAFKTAVVSAITAILPGFMPVAPPPPVRPEEILVHGSDATGPAIPLTVIETHATEPTPSHRARSRWW